MAVLEKRGGVGDTRTIAARAVLREEIPKMNTLYAVLCAQGLYTRLIDSFFFLFLKIRLKK